MGEAQLAREQHEVCKLIYLIKGTAMEGRSELEAEWELIKEARKKFGVGGERRLKYTIVPVIYALAMVPRLRPEDALRKKVFQVVYKTIEALQPHNPTEALQASLISAVQVQSMLQSGNTISYEYLKMVLQIMEEHLDGKDTFQAILQIVGVLPNILLSEDNREHVVTHVTKMASRLLATHEMVRAVAACSHLQWTKDGQHRDPVLVMQCLEKALKELHKKISDKPQLVVVLCEILDKYIYYFEQGIEECNVQKMSLLMEMILTHIAACKEAKTNAEARRAESHLREILSYISRKIKNGDEKADQLVGINVAAVEDKLRAT